MFVMHLLCYEAKQPNLKMKTRPKQLLGSLPLAFALPVQQTGLWVKRRHDTRHNITLEVAIWPVVLLVVMLSVMVPVKLVKKIFQ